MTLARNIGFRLPSWRWPTARTVFVAATVWLAAAMPSVRSLGDDLGKADDPPLATIAEAKATAKTEARSPVRVRGVLTFRIGEGFAIQDDSAGMWVEVTQARRLELLRSEMAAVWQLRPGDDIEVVGLADRGGYAPTILPMTVSKLGERPLPEPRGYDRDRFFRGLDDCLRVTVEGVVQGYRDDVDNRRWNLLVEDCSRLFWVGVNKDSLPGTPAAIIDSAVRCVGVASAHFNTRSELIEPRLNVSRPEDFRVLCPGEADPFAASEVPLAAIARYPVTSHRVRTKGTVTYALPGNFMMLQDGSIGVRVEAATTHRFIPGDIAEVSGFVSTVTPVAGLIEAVVRRVGAVSAPEADGD
jgi:hypothetical protein